VLVFDVGLICGQFSQRIPLLATATSTGSATAIVEIYPDLGLAVRVPLSNGSLTDCVFEVKHPVLTVEEVNAALKEASESGPLKGILGYETKPLASSDYYTDDTRSSIIDSRLCTKLLTAPWSRFILGTTTKLVTPSA
jgi:glyceraldehyde-3-phosphate dehydrogenase/erythrose-4-phosphate dehydrogenase